MRKVILVLSIFAFLSCLAAGIFVAQNSIQSLDGESDSREINRPLSTYQHNILLIHVDQLENKQPQMISVWGLILYFPEPKIILQSIYPYPLSGESLSPASFKINDHKKPNASFLQQVERQTQMKWDHYILIDHYALSIFAADLTPQEEIISPGLNDGIISVETALFTKLCQEFATLDYQTFQQIHWSHIIPEHWHSNLPFDEAILNWEKLVSPEIPVKCEVFGE
ncbi:MAG: hypothetical protein AB1522_00380 [Chloroflexota bacterium]